MTEEELQIVDPITETVRSKSTYLAKYLENRYQLTGFRSMYISSKFDRVFFEFYVKDGKVTKNEKLSTFLEILAEEAFHNS